MIPKTIQFVWIGDRPLPGWAERNIEEFGRLNPGYGIQVHGAEALHPDYRASFDACLAIEQKADLIRYSVLEREGGWYFDVDFWPFRPLADAESAWELTGEKLVISRQQGHLSGDKLPYANAPIACEARLPLWNSVRAEILRRDSRRRTAYGPELMIWIVQSHPDAVEIMGAPFWFPSAIADAPYDYAVMRSGDRGWARRMCGATGGQLPFAMHLWAGGKPELRTVNSVRPRAVILAHPNGPEVKTFAEPNATWPDGHALGAAKTGLEAAGYDVICANKGFGAAPRFLPGGGPVRVAVAWNGMREPIAGAISAFRSAGVTVFICEHGFWDRRRYVQCDAAGFLHRACWADDWAFAPPANAAELFAEAWPNGITPMMQRLGDVLLIGQVGGDTQLADSALAGPAPLERLIVRNLPRGTPARFRPHPLARSKDRLDEKARRTQLPRDVGDLMDSLAKAQFVVTINSNAIVECLIAGVPVLAFGPSTAINAGVARLAKEATLARDLEVMRKGWRPAPEAVERYLHWLAVRHVRVRDMRSAEFWEERLKAVGRRLEGAA